MWLIVAMSLALAAQALLSVVQKPEVLMRLMVSAGEPVLSAYAHLLANAGIQEQGIAELGLDIWLSSSQPRALATTASGDLALSVDFSAVQQIESEGLADVAVDDEQAALKLLGFP